MASRVRWRRGKNTRKVSPSNPSIVPLNDVSNAQRKGGRADRGRPLEVGDSSPCSKAKKRRATPNSWRCIPPHAHVSTSKRKRGVTNHSEIERLGSTAREKEGCTAGQQRVGRRSGIILSWGNTDTHIPRKRKTRASSRVAGSFFPIPSEHGSRRAGSPCSPKSNPSDASAPKSKQQKRLDMLPPLRSTHVRLQTSAAQLKQLWNKRR